MTKRLIKNLMLILAVVMLCFAVGVTASALEATGQCGDNVSWNYDETTGELVISGEGAMWDYGWDSYSPFYNSEIKTLKCEGGVTTIGDYTFSNCKNLIGAEISDTVTTIGEGAFEVCLDLEKIVLPESLIDIGYQAFATCLSIKELDLPSNLKNIVLDFALALQN